MLEDNNQSLVAVNNEALVQVGYDIEELIAEPINGENSLAIPSGYDGFKARLDTLIPMIGDVAAAVPGKDAAIVRFPKVDGKQLGWNDLINRKTPGWEEWKQLGGFGKDGKFNPQAAIQKAGLKNNPAAVANLALQGAAIVVGQAYMTEINNKLEVIETGIATIERMLERDKEAQIEGNFRALKRYAANLEDNSLDPQKRQAVIGSLENIRTETLQLWSYQIKSMNEFKKELAKPGRLDAKKAEEAVGKLHKLEEASAATYQLMMLVEQTSMQYDNDFSERRIGKAKAEAEGLLAEYQASHDDACMKLGSKVDKVKGLAPIAVAKRRKLAEKPVNLLDGVVKNAGEVAERITPIALLDEGKRKKELKKQELRRNILAGDNMVDVANNQVKYYEKLDFMFNKADGLLIADGEIKFIESN